MTVKEILSWAKNEASQKELEDCAKKLYKIYAIKRNKLKSKRNVKTKNSR